MISRYTAEFRLYFLGFFTLFLELVFIRFLSGNVWNLGYFPNLVLFGVFLGMGSGFAFHSRFSEAASERLHAFSIPLLFSVALLLTFVHPSLPGFRADSGALGGDLMFTSVPEGARSAFDDWILLGLFLATVVFFFCVSQQTAKRFRCFPPLKAYTLDIFGSVSGILLFIFISALRLPAWCWFALGIPLYLGTLPGAGAAVRLVGVVFLGGLACLSRFQDTHFLAGVPVPAENRGRVEVVWSPYQKVEFDATNGVNKRILVNGILHQVIHDIDHLRNDFYGIPYEYRESRKLPAYRRVLIIGAGSGNDAAMALYKGAESVDAVEIDPVIAGLGRKHHPARPFEDPRLHLTIDDGRAFLTAAKGKYDLIIFALTDSLVKVSAVSQLRLENFLYTTESMQRAFELLQPDGDLVLYNSYRTPWLINKLSEMLLLATHRTPQLLLEKDNFAVLEVSRLAPAAYLEPEKVEIVPATDDWPFLYLQDRAIPGFYLYALTGVSLLVLGLLWLFERHHRQTFALPARELAAQLYVKVAFILMGIAFFLLETKGVIQFSLLFGTTWLNNSLVFLAVLSSVLAANWVARHIRESHFQLIYLLLMAASMAEVFYPLSRLLVIESFGLRFLAASLMAISPVFFANLLFSLLFRDQKFPEIFFGWNLIGASLGGVLEYLAMITGYDALALVVACLYSFVFLLFLRAHRAAAGESPAVPAGQS